MSLTVQLLNNASPVEKIGKTLSNGVTFNCVLKENTSILDPVIFITTSDAVYGYNYMYIQELGRYYFIKDIVSVNHVKWEVHGHVDVLETYGTQILANEAVVKRQAKNFNLYLNDPEFCTLNPEKIQTLKFPSGFNKTLNNILVINGS